MYPYGQKLGEIAKPIKRIPKDEKILLFVQFPNVLSHLNHALDKEKIIFSALNSGSRGDCSSKLMAFQKNEIIGSAADKRDAAKNGEESARVLMLNIGDAFAAGR